MIKTGCLIWLPSTFGIADLLKSLSSVACYQFTDINNSQAFLMVFANNQSTPSKYDGTPNPYAPTTLSHGGDHDQLSTCPKGRLVYLYRAVFFVPLICYAYLWMFWLLGSAWHGAPVQPGKNDPSEFFYGLPNLVHAVLITLAFAMLPVVAIIGYLGQRTFRLGVLYAAQLLLVIMLYRLDIMQLTAWISD